MPLAIIDINGPELNQEDGLKVLENFSQLDELLQSIQLVPLPTFAAFALLCKGTTIRKG